MISKSFTNLLLCISLVMITNLNAQTNSKKGSYVGQSGTVYSHYEGNGELNYQFGEEGNSYYCYECRTFHHVANHHSEPENRNNIHEKVGTLICDEHESSSCGHSYNNCNHCKESYDECNNCSHSSSIHDNHEEDVQHYTKHIHNMECVDCDYNTARTENCNHESKEEFMEDRGLIVKYRPNKMKVKCNVCNAKWKVAYPKDREYYYDVNDDNDKIILGHSH